MKRLLIVLFLISVLTRIAFVPLGYRSVSNDEADLYLSSYLVAKTGTDIFNNRFHLTTGILTAKPSIPVYFGVIPWLLFSEKSVTIARTYFALVNSVTPVLFFILIFLLSKNRLLSLLSFAVFNFSPWFSFISTTGYEALIGLLFVSAALIVSVLKINKKNVPAFCALLCGLLFLAFNAYMPLKIVLIFLAPFLFYRFFRQNVPSLKLPVILAICISFIGICYGLAYFAPNSQLVRSEFSTLTSYYEPAQIQGKVWFEHLTIDGPDLLKKIMSNKITIRAREYIMKYFTSFDMQMFFWKGDPSALYGSADLSGFFFLTDFVFFIIGLLFLSNHLRAPFIALYAVIFIAGIPSALTKTAPTYVLRGLIMLLPYSFIIARGMYQTVRRYKWASAFLIILFVANYLIYTVFFTSRVRILNADQWRGTDKTIVDMAVNMSAGKPIRIVDAEAREAFVRYAFYHIDNPTTIKNHLNNKNYKFGNISFVLSCPKTTEELSSARYVFRKDDCLKTVQEMKSPYSFLTLSQNKSGNDVYITR